MHKRIIILVGIIFSAMNACADHIYLKSGEVLEGKIRKSGEKVYSDMWCQGEDKIIVAGRCLSNSEVEKVEKVIKKPEGVALLAKEENWGKVIDGYQYQLIPASVEYKIGQPMLFHLLMRNVTDDVKWFQHEIDQVSLTVTDENGNIINGKVGSRQFGEGPKQPIDKNEIMVMFEGGDIADSFVLTKAGKYSVQYKYGESNVVTLNVLPGIPYEEDVLFEKMHDLLKKDDGWLASLTSRREGRPTVYLNNKWIDGVGVYFEFFGPSIGIYQVKELMDISPDKTKSGTSTFIFAGQDKDGKYYYFSIFELDKLTKIWPTFKEDIRSKLELK